LKLRKLFAQDAALFSAIAPFWFVPDVYQLTIGAKSPSASESSLNKLLGAKTSVFALVLRDLLSGRSSRLQKVSVDSLCEQPRRRHRLPNGRILSLEVGWRERLICFLLTDERFCCLTFDNHVAIGAIQFDINIRWCSFRTVENRMLRLESHAQRAAEPKT
jgi:hypothetical protein